MKLLILGAAGQISRLLITRLLKETDHELVLLARNSTQRLKNVNCPRVSLIDGDFSSPSLLHKAMKDVDAVYLNSMGKSEESQLIRTSMEANKVNKIIGATILGIYDEVEGAFGKWNTRMVGKQWIQAQVDSVTVFEQSELDYTMLRLTWLYNDSSNHHYDITHKGDPFKGTEVTREGVVQLILDILSDQTGRYTRTSLGVGDASKLGNNPSFY
jgi:hypothetical protein